ncbi:hypothetical protein CDSM653_02117 [Caldanaerobacter subterraneus subsp. pacificus DSM 12653]|uniref:Uncharacterized protein n=1 Tax=Caldanaerobacter subterraneus subsp. pacificus DSM 12653 TaxID=391606 RepID=A0A0F5PJQ4_9THEO|nr:hypothetical protein CDSM653_02117 [Caldanaerobacter subterraneus subsp. pacificus DSM 12653]
MQLEFSPKLYSAKAQRRKLDGKPLSFVERGFLNFAEKRR